MSTFDNVYSVMSVVSIIVSVANLVYLLFMHSARKRRLMTMRDTARTTLPVSRILEEADELRCESCAARVDCGGMSATQKAAWILEHTARHHA